MHLAAWEAYRAFSGRAAECIRGPPAWAAWRFLWTYAVGALGVFVALAATTTPIVEARTSHVYESAITVVPTEVGEKPVLMPGLLRDANSMTAYSGDLYVAEFLPGEGIAGSAARTDQWRPSVSKPGEYEFVSQLPLPPKPEPNNRLYKGIALGVTTGETEMYIGRASFPGKPAGVNVYAAGLCGELECAVFQKFWTGIEAPSPFAEVSGVAVDHSTSPGNWASGDVFIADGEGEAGTHNVVDIFQPEAGGNVKYVRQVIAPSPNNNFGTLSGVAVSGFNGDLVIGADAINSEGNVYLFRPQEEGAKNGQYIFVQRLTPPSGPLKEVQAVAIDDRNGEIYVATNAEIYEFGPEGTFRGGIVGVPEEGLPGGVKGQGKETRLGVVVRPVSIAVDPESHRVFVGLVGSQAGPKGESVAVVDVFSPDVVVPDVETKKPFDLELETNGAGAHSWSVVATGTVNPDSAGEASCWFVWGTSRQALNKVAPCEGAVPDGGKPVPVDAGLSGLEPDTTYYYRLQAQNEHGTNLGEESQDYEFTTPGPGLESESVSTVSSSSVKLKATIAPHDTPSYPASESERRRDFQEPAKTPTTYYFQYGKEPTEGCFSSPSSCTNVPLTSASTGTGVDGVEVEQPVSGLTPNTTYHYRVVALNEALPSSVPGFIPNAEPGVQIAFSGPDHTFTTQGPGRPAPLPDRRSWELVSPVDKHGARVETGAQAAVDGGKFTYVTGTPSTSTNGYDGNGNQVLALRVKPGVWSNMDIALSHNSPTGVFAGVSHEYRFFSEDLSVGIAESLGPFSVPTGWHENEHGEWENIVEAFPVPGERTPYLRHNLTCESNRSRCYEPLLDEEDTQSSEPYGGNQNENEGLANFAGAASDGSHAVIGSPVQLTATPASEGGLYEWSADTTGTEKLSLVSVLSNGIVVGHVGTQRRSEGLLALSDDGSRLVFGENGQGSNGKVRWEELYVHDTPNKETMPLGLTEAGLSIGGLKFFQGASADVAKVFFTDTAPLAKGSGSGSVSGESGDLYLCEVAQAPLQCSLRDLTPVPEAEQPGASESAQVSRVLGVSRDGGYVYFLGKGVQAKGAIPGTENLYVAHEHEGQWTTSFIASSASGFDLASAISPNGQWLAFSSDASLTSYDNRDAKTGLLDSEVYLYDARSEKLSCVSCNSTGARPIGSAEVPSPTRPRGSVEFIPPVGIGNTRPLFDSGRLFFNSGDALASQDTNSNVDVYEFEPPSSSAGVGDCSSASATFDANIGGCLGLISSGVAYGPSVFMEASGTGGDVFFTTGERLVPEDVDTAVDVYDAHECSSTSPCRSRTQQTEKCGSATTCRAAPTAQPSFFGAPSSATFSGTGNVISGGSPGPPPPTPEELRKEKLAKALKVCRKKRNRGKRVACERAARARYAVKASRSSARRSTASARRGKRR